MTTSITRATIPSDPGSLARVTVRFGHPGSSMSGAGPRRGGRVAWGRVAAPCGRESSRARGGTGLVRYRACPGPPRRQIELVVLRTTLMSALRVATRAFQPRSTREDFRIGPERPRFAGLAGPGRTRQNWYFYLAGSAAPPGRWHWAGSARRLAAGPCRRRRRALGAGPLAPPTGRAATGTVATGSAPRPAPGTSGRCRTRRPAVRPPAGSLRGRWSVGRCWAGGRGARARTRARGRCPS